MAVCGVLCRLGVEEGSEEKLLFLRSSNRLLGLLGQEVGVDVGKNTTRSNGDTREELVQFVIVLDGQLDVSGHNPRLLVVTSGVSSQLEDLSSQVFENGSQVDRGTSTNTTSVTTTAELRVNTTDRELETGLGRTRDSLRARSRSASAFLSRHVVV